MKCKYCGRQIPDGELYCAYCGKEVQIVPDYNPLEDMLAEQVKGSINGEDYDYLEYTSQKNSDRMRTTSVRRSSAQNQSPDRRVNSQGNRRPPIDEREQRRRQAERKKALKRKKQKKILIILAVILVAIIGVSVFLYQNSYTGIVKKGQKALQEKEYNDAMTYFQKAISKDNAKRDAYDGIAQIYIEQDKIVAAEQVYLDVIEKQSENADIYEGCIELYLATEQAMEIPKLLKDASDSVRDALNGYIVEEPTFSLDADMVYEDVQQLSLESNAEKIYYTLDEREPTTDSTEFKEPIQISEGETVVKAIAVNKKGVPSLSVTKTFVVQFPIVDAPAVSPSTGQYEEYMEIEVKVPDGYDAYYTTDGSNPTSASKKYYGPVDMPEGETLFKVILINRDGRSSGITTRNYILEFPEEDE